MNQKSSFRFPNIIKEEKKEVWGYIEYGFPRTLAVGPLIEIHYPEYKSCLCKREIFINMGEL